MYEEIVVLSTFGKNNVIMMNKSILFHRPISKCVLNLGLCCSALAKDLNDLCLNLKNRMKLSLNSSLRSYRWW